MAVVTEIPPGAIATFSAKKEIVPLPSWVGWFKGVFLCCFSVQESGTTAQRPTKNLWVGRRYFDTSLGANGKPIWVDKTGAAWVDGSGASV